MRRRPGGGFWEAVAEDGERLLLEARTSWATRGLRAAWWYVSVFSRMLKRHGGRTSQVWAPVSANAYSPWPRPSGTTRIPMHPARAASSPTTSEHQLHGSDHLGAAP